MPSNSGAMRNPYGINSAAALTDPNITLNRYCGWKATNRRMVRPSICRFPPRRSWCYVGSKGSIRALFLGTATGDDLLRRPLLGPSDFPSIYPLSGSNSCAASTSKSFSHYHLKRLQKPDFIEASSHSRRAWVSLWSRTARLPATGRRVENEIPSPSCSGRLYC